MQAWLDGESCLSQTHASNFRRPLQSLLLIYTTENALSACANKIFQKWTVFVFTESWLRDQVMQRAYWLSHHIRSSHSSSRELEPILFTSENYDKIKVEITKEI